MWDWGSVAEAAGQLNMSRNFQLFHNELVGAGVFVTAGAGAFAGIAYMMRRHMDQLMENMVPIAVGGGIIAGSLGFATGMTGGAGGATLGALPLPLLTEVLSDIAAHSAYWSALLAPGLWGWARWRR